MTSFESAGSPFGSGMFQLMSNSVRSTVVSSYRPTRFLPKWSTAGPLTVPVSVAGLRDALDRDLAVELDACRRRGERRSAVKLHLGVALGVEELGRLQVGLQVLVLQAEAGDARRALQLAVDECCVEVGDLAAERRDGVGDFEGDARVDGVGLPRAGRERLLSLFDGAVILISS